MFRADATGLIGWGHLRRCLALADALRARGAQCIFVGALDAGAATLVIRAGHVFQAITTASPGGGRGWDAAPWDEAAQSVDAEAFLAVTPDEAEWVVVDHYKLNALWERRILGTRRLLVIDDLANRQHIADLLLDQSLGRLAEDYRGLIPADACVVTGPRWALLRPEFAAQRAAALDRREHTIEPRCVLVSLGSTDIGGLTVAASRAAVALDGVERVEVVLGRAAPSLAEIDTLSKRDPRVRLHVDSDDMAALMRDADLAIGAPGSMSWERCCLALPCVMLILADNQRMIARSLAACGAALITQSVAALPRILEQASRPDKLKSMSAAAAPVCDGLGSARLADLMLVNMANNLGFC